MKIVFNDSQELTIQSATVEADGSLLIKTISADEDVLKRLFLDDVATKKMTVTEHESVLGVYENYTKMDAIVKYTAGILGVVMFEVGEAPDDRMTALEKENQYLQALNTEQDEMILDNNFEILLLKEGIADLTPQ